MKKIIFDDPFIKKNSVKDDYIYDKNNQILFLNNIIDNIDFSYNDFIIKDIKKKFSSYKSQDKQKIAHGTDMSPPLKSVDLNKSCA